MRETLTRLLAVSTLVSLSWTMGCGSDTKAKRCADLSCSEHQVCQEASGDKNAKCLEDCDAGFVWNGATSACEMAATCVSLDCAGQGRVCLNNPSGVQCGDCAVGWRLVGDDCVQMTSCEPLPAEGVSILNECGGLGRECVELVAGEAECGACLQASHVVDTDTGSCRTPLTCGDVTCADPLVCNEGAGTDAYCDPNCQGPNGEPGIVDSDRVCILCPPCDDTANGEAGPYLGGLSGSHSCICETATGYYWQEGTNLGVTPCDADGDGWVRFSAKAALDSPSTVVLERAHCDFREIESVMLHNVNGESYSIPVSPPAIAFESDRNDDPTILAQALDNNYSSIAELSSGRRPKAEELNSLTKYCVTELGDFNGNEIEDIEEWHESTATVHPVFQPLLNFTYFAELHRGWFEFNTPPRGTYHIAEKSRDELAEAGWQVPFKRQDDGNDYWRSCTRKVDSEYGARTDNFQGLDFASHNEATAEFSGMAHHSQFKCHKIVPVLGIEPPPHHTTKALLDSDFPGCPTQPIGAREACKPRVNNCVAATTSGPDVAWNTFNPSSADMICSVAAVAPDSPAVRWVAYGFFDSYPPGAYIRGCVNECEETVDTCPACSQTGETCPGTSLPGADCEANASDYGVRQCGCGSNWGGVGCDWVCPSTNLFLDASLNPDPFPIAPRQPGLLWMCGEFTATHYVDSTAYMFHENTPPTTGLTVEGGAYLNHPVRGWACQASDCSSGLIIK